MTETEMLSFLNEIDDKLCHELEPFQRVPYGEIVGAPYPYCCQGELTYGDPDLDMIYEIHKDIKNYIEYLESVTATLNSNQSPFDNER